GSFYPEKLAAAKMLAFYAERLPAVEINYTFYRMPTVKTIAGWRAATPDGFTFVLKASKRITHDARLREVEQPLRYLCDTALQLGPQLGPLLFQLPPFFPKDTERLGEVLRLLPAEIRSAWEFRHASWFADDVYHLLRSCNAALVVADTEAGTTPEVATADFGYFRLRDEGYGDEDLARWAERVRALGGGVGWRDAFVFFKHEAAGQGPELARRFAGLF
ncbi:MAG: DUF72 domain-containing protein, partial [Gemmatimonadales bacterium]